LREAILNAGRAEYKSGFLILEAAFSVELSGVEPESKKLDHPRLRV